MTVWKQLLVGFVVGCAGAEPAVPDAPETPPTTGSVSPVDQLNAMDPRTPVPLQPMMAWHQKQNMQEHLVAIQRITDGLAREDWDMVAAGAGLIASSPTMQMQCEHMGQGADGFTSLALDFHSRADRIVTAAGAKDPTATLVATADTLAACTGCHARFRQDVVDAATWEARTGSTMAH